MGFPSDLKPAGPLSPLCHPSFPRLTKQAPQFDDVLEDWTAALALHALLQCSELQELSLAWPQGRFTDEAVQALQVGARSLPSDGRRCSLPFFKTPVRLCG